MELVDERISIKCSAIDWIDYDSDGNLISEEDRQRKIERIEASAAVEIFLAWY